MLKASFLNMLLQFIYLFQGLYPFFNEVKPRLGDAFKHQP